MWPTNSHIMSSLQSNDKSMSTINSNNYLNEQSTNDIRYIMKWKNI